MRWCNPRPPKDAYDARSVRYEWEPRMLGACLFGLCALIQTGLFERGFFGAAAIFFFSHVLVLMREERQKLNEYLTRKHFS